MMREEYDFSNATANRYADRVAGREISTPVSRGEQQPSGVIEIYPEQAGFRWRVKTKDGTILANSDKHYDTLDACRDAMAELLKAMACPTTLVPGSP